MARRSRAAGERRRPRGRSSRSLGILGDLRLDRRLGWILAIFLLLIGGIVGYNALAMAAQRPAALIVNVAARQRSQAERYIKDVLLSVQGFQADPGEDAHSLLGDSEALLHGGKVEAVQGADGEVTLPPASDWRVVAKLEEERRLIDKLITTGDRLMQTSPGDPGFDAQVLSLRVIGAQVSSTTNDTVGQMTGDAVSAFGRLVAVGIGLGLLGAFAAVAMGLLLRRAGAQQSAQFRSLVDQASDLITVVDVDGLIKYQSPSVERVLGYRPGDLIGTSCFELLGPDDAARFRGTLHDLTAEGGGSTNVEYRVLHENGSWRSLESMVTDLTADPVVKGLVLNARDVTERKALEEELVHQAFHDSLTGLSNRALFRDRIDHALTRAGRHNDYLAVLLLDLDGFKMINDSLGHDAGDELLVAVAERILAASRSSDTVARLGGDEFGILLEDEVDHARAGAVAERLLDELGAPFAVRGREVFVGASVGIAMTEGGIEETDELIRNADAAMYAAKSRGRGRYEVFEPEMHARAVERLEVQGDLQGALSRDEFVLHYQPIVNLATGGVEGTEALLRWRHPARGLVMPNDFIPVTEETGIIVPLGYWVLREACAQTAAWRADQPNAGDLWVSVNLSGRQLADPHLVSTVRSVLRETKLDPPALVLEITEGNLMQGIAETTLKLQALKQLGVRLAIDDFGTGSSSLGYLRQFPIDLLKIDKSFVDDVTPSASDGSALVEAIVQLAHTLRLDTVAEGIEVLDQLAGLRSVGCHYGQGFLFARPLEPEALGAFLRRPEEASPAVA